MQQIQNIFIKKIMAFFERLTSKPVIGSLVISDSSLEYLVIGMFPKAFSIRLPPGVMRDGKIFDAGQFAGFLTQLRVMVDGNKRQRSVPVVVVIPPGVIYTQNFQVPNIGRDGLDESAYLNLRMISPIPENLGYMSYQIINEMADKYELLGAVAERQYIEELRVALEKCGFSPIVFEFPGLALARAVSEYLGGSEHASVFFQISGDGLELLIVQNGGLYFDYFRSWRSIQGEERQISREIFQGVISQEIQKVLNFALSHFKESIKQIFLIAPGFEQEMQNFIQTRFGMTVTPLVLPIPSLAPNWYTALGAAIRANMDRANDRFITLSNISSAESFHEEQVINFTVLWRNIFVTVLSIFLVIFGGVSYFLGNEADATKAHLAIFTSSSQKNDLSELEARASKFNALVKTVSDVKSTSEPWGLFLERLNTVSRENHVSIDSISDMNSFKGAISISARTVDYNMITDFKSALSSQPDFRDVDLSISRITTLDDGLISFSMTFLFDPEKSPKS